MAKMETEKPAKDSQFVLLPCRWCGEKTILHKCRHDAQLAWNEGGRTHD